MQKKISELTSGEKFLFNNEKCTVLGVGPLTFRDNPIEGKTLVVAQLDDVSWCQFRIEEDNEFFVEAV